MIQKYDWAKLEGIEITVPCESYRRTFSIGEIKMNDCFEWTLKLCFPASFSTVNAQYKLVFAPNPEPYEGDIRDIVREYNKSQQSLDDVIAEDDEEQTDKLDPVNRIVKVFRSYNDAIARMGIYEIHWELEKYDRKARTKDVVFLISKADIPFLCDMRPSDGWCVYLEAVERATEENGKIYFAPYSYDAGEFVNQLPIHEDFLIDAKKLKKLAEKATDQAEKNTHLKGATD